MSIETSPIPVLSSFFDDEDEFALLLDDADSLAWNISDNEFVADIQERFDEDSMKMVITGDEIARLRSIAEE